MSEDSVHINDQNKCSGTNQAGLHGKLGANCFPAHKPPREQRMKQDDATQMLRLFLGRTYFAMPAIRKKGLVQLVEHLPPGSMMRRFEQELRTRRVQAEERAKTHQRIAEFWGTRGGLPRQAGPPLYGYEHR